jgi:hypothetical protein
VEFFSDANWSNREPVAQRVFTRNSDWTLLADASNFTSPKLVVDPALRERVRDCVSSNLSGTRRIEQREGHSFLSVRASGPPIAVGFDVWVLDGTRQTLLGSIACRPREFGWSSLDAILWHLQSDSVTIVLKPNPAAAHTLLDETEIWGEEVSLGPYPVYRQ